MAAKDTSVTTIDDTPEVVATPRAKKVAVTDHADGMSGEKMEVTIHAGEGELGRQAVFLSLNGYGFNVPRGKPVELPIEVVEILDNATMTKYEQGANGQMVEHEVKRYSYNARSIRNTLAK